MLPVSFYFVTTKTRYFCGSARSEPLLQSRPRKASGKEAIGHQYCRLVKTGTMKQIFKDVTRSVARGVFGVDISAVGATFATAPTYTEEIRSLLDALSPVVCEHALIRLGPNGDGGYLVPDDLEGIAACFSPGVSSVSGFELACAQRGMRVYMADKSVDEPAEKHPQFHFQKKYIGATTNSDFATLDHWISESIASTEEDDLILQMDIEGYEYETFTRRLRRAAPAVSDYRCRIS